MTDTKIQGKFYPLQHEEWLRACRELTPAQRDVLYYLRTLDPYSTGMEVSPARIAKDLSTPEKPVHRSTVGRALKALDEKGFVDMELLKVKVHVLTKGLHCCDEATSCTEATSCDEATLLPDGNLGDRDATCAIATQLARSPRNKHEPEASPDKDSSTPKINKTYLDFIDSLSEEERAKFLEFCEEKAKNLSQPVNDIEAWLAHTTKAGKNRWEVYYKKFSDCQQTSSKKPQNSRGSQMKKKFEEELEQQRQQAMAMSANS
jgi:DNA-binding MarR family transcriptional regulator